MMCCKECPFNSKSSISNYKCNKEICICDNSGNNSDICANSIGTRCFMDYYVLNNLGKGDKLAIKLASYSIQSALLGRDRSLLTALLYIAPTGLRKLLWKVLKHNETRSLCLLNPIFTNSGLEELNEIPEKPEEKYLKSITSISKSIQTTQANSMLRRLSNEL